MAMSGSPRMSIDDSRFSASSWFLPERDDAGLVPSGENTGDVDDFRFAAAGDRRIEAMQAAQRQAAPGNDGEDQRQRDGLVIVTDEVESFDQALDALERLLGLLPARADQERAGKSTPSGSKRMPVLGS